MRARLATLAVAAAAGVAAAGALGACATTSAVPAARFANRAPVAAVDDRRDVPAQPAVREHTISLYVFDGYFYRYVTRALDLPGRRRAAGVNALDAVPDSTWFTNRIGVRDLAPDAIRVGPSRVGSPELHKPWTIKSTKVGGRSVGFIIKDARGKKFILKFDRAGYPEVETAAAVIVNRLLWAAGYNVPEDHVVYLRRADLRVAPDAVIKDWSGTRGRLTDADVDRALATVVTEPDGRIRAMASLFLDGKPIGGHPAEGVRADDPNDRIPHELRRDLRGAQPIFAWLDHNDLKEDNTLDVWVTDPADPARHYVKHYFLDFGGALGGGALWSRDPRLGHLYHIDFPGAARSLVTAGLAPRPWIDRRPTGLRGVGMFDARTYRPDAWRQENPAYLPTRLADDADKLWGATILIRFTRDQLRAAVDAGRLTDPRAAAYLVETLVARQRATARHVFSRINPLDRFTVTAGAAPALCFDDLLLSYGLAPVAGYTRYTVTSHDHAGRRLGAPATVAATADGRRCVPVALATDPEGYTIVAIRTRRLDFDGSTFVHIARDRRTGGARVIGIWRP